MEEYNIEKRSVFEQELLISQDLKQKLFDKLNATLLSEDRYYTYKFIDKNCTSMVVDIINNTLNENVIVKKGDTLYRIAKQNKCSIESIKELNKLNGNNLKIGSELQLPIP
jgi:LysM repeat protein